MMEKTSVLNCHQKDIRRILKTLLSTVLCIPYFPPHILSLELKINAHDRKQSLRNCKLDQACKHSNVTSLRWCYGIYGFYLNIFWNEGILEINITLWGGIKKYRYSIFTIWTVRPKSTEIEQSGSEDIKMTYKCSDWCSYWITLILLS